MRRPARAPMMRLHGIVLGERLSGEAMAPGVRVLAFRDVGAVVSEERGPRPPPPPDVGAHRAIVSAVFAHHTIVPAPPGIVFRSADTLIGWIELHYVVLHDALAYLDGRVEARVHVGPAEPVRQGSEARELRLARSERASPPRIEPRPEPRVEPRAEPRAEPRGLSSDPRAAGVRGAAGPLSTDAAALDLFRSLGRAVAAWVLTGVPAHSIVNGEGLAARLSGIALPAEAGDGSGAPAATGRDVAELNASFLVDRLRWREFVRAVEAQAQQDPALRVVLTGPWPPYDFVRLQFGG